MNEVIFIVLMFICTCVFVKSFFRYEQVLQFPFLITCDLLIFMGPQMYYLLNNKKLYEDYGRHSLALFVFVCMLFYISALLGYSSKNVKFRIPNWQFSPNMLIAGLFVLSAIAAYGRVQLAALPAELTSMGQWTGLPVRYLFFVSVGSLCVPLGVVLFFKYRKMVVLIPLLMELGSIVNMVVMKGRRTPALFAGLMVLTGLWFSKRVKAPTWMIITGGVIFFMFVANVGTYRYMLSKGNVDWKEVAGEVFNLKKTVSRFSEEESTGGDSSEDDLGNYVDVLNGLVCTKAAFSSFRYNYGCALWNSLVHSWVPGQLVGKNLKESLKVELGRREKIAEEVYKYKWHIGSCLPGYGEIFAAFGFFGVFFAYFMGKIARMIWEQAMTGNLIAQTCHFALAPVYIRWGGGGLWPLLCGLIFWVIFLLPIYMVAKKSNVAFDESLVVEA